MSKKPIVVFLLTAACALSALVVSRQQQVSAAGAAPAVQQRPANVPAASLSSDAIPEHVTYDVLFRQIAAFKKKASELDARGGNGDPLRRLVYEEAKLNAAEAEKIDRIQSEYMRLVGSMDKRAKKIIEEARLRNPTGKLAEGAPLPEPPPELRTLQQKRNGLTLRARGQVREALGEQGFRNFGEFVKEHIARKLKPVEFQGGRPHYPGGDSRETPHR